MRLVFFLLGALLAPVCAQAKVMASQDVMLSGAGADQFAREQGLEQIENSWFATPLRRQQLESFNTPGMYRAKWSLGGGPKQIEFYGDDK